MRNLQRQVSLFLFGLLICLVHIQARFIIPDQQYYPSPTDSSFFSSTSSSYTSEFETRVLDSTPHTGHEPAVTLRLYGSTWLGYYYITLFFGTPPQRQNLIVDTGSTITTIPCTGCGSNCGTQHMNKQFNPAASSSNSDFTCREKFGNYMCSDCQTKCHFEISYTEGSSYQGHYTKDYVVFGDDIEEEYFRNSTGNTALRPEQSSEGSSSIATLIDRRKIFMPFGCTSKETNLFYSQEADGIFGLGVHTNNDRIPPNVIDVFDMSKQDAINAFSICYASENGLFTIGGYNTSHHDPEETISYIPFHSETGQYRVNLQSIEFQGKDLGLSKQQLNSGQGAFFDSGTTLSYAPADTVEAIKTALEGYCEQSERNCGGNKRERGCWEYNPHEYPTLEEFYASFGTFSFYFGETEAQKYEWRPQDYLYQDSPELLQFCFGLDKFKGRTILGGTFMKNHDVLFDKSKKRLGFIRANCTIEMPEWIKTTTPTDSLLFDNLKALCIIILGAMIIYCLLRLNRANREAERLPTSSSSAAPGPETQKSSVDPNFRHHQMVEMAEEGSIPRIDDSEDTETK